MLQDYDFATNLDTSNNDLIEDFFIPALGNSIHYDRGVGFFSSGWLKIAAEGMTVFANNGGKARWVTSPILSQEDWNALIKGDNAKDNSLLYEILKKNIENLSISLEKDTLTAISWMVADNIIEFKIALPRNKLDQGEFHDKFGIFEDENGDSLSFNGSYNDSIQGTKNYESIKIFKSWDDFSHDWVISDKKRFEILWNNEDPNVQVFNLQSALKERIIKLRKRERPYRKRENKNIFPSLVSQTSLHIPSSIEIRPYQQNAINSWFANNCKGIFEMATGTGKTITSLTASVKLFNKENRLALIVLCPYIHLVDQWEKEAVKFGYSPVLAYTEKNSWINKVNEKIVAYNHKDIKHICIISTHSTFATEDFLNSILRISGPSLLIADEVHHLGAEKSTKYFPPNIESKLALSATPNRWFDEAGTQKIISYFGDTVFSFPLKDAIQSGFLSPYYYYPIIIKLTDQEMAEYDELSLKIAVFFARGESPDENQFLLNLLIKRSGILNNAANKIPTLAKLTDQQKDISHTLYYCAPGQIDFVIKMLGNEKRIIVHRFTSHEGALERQELLNNFANGKIQGLVAIRCLDEGVDVPSTRVAYILASSSNPREFIQRRGRILRKFEGKEDAIIYDFITIPSIDKLKISETERKIIKKELSRFKEFAESSNNFNSAYDVIWEIAKNFNVLDF